MKIVAGARNDGRKPFDFEVTEIGRASCRERV